MAFCRSVWPAALVALLLLLGACDASFEPYKETDQTFSLFGILDPTDEQQRVRVEVLQDDNPFSADTVTGATVTLERVATGRTVVLANERVFFRGLKHNFVTEKMNVRLGETYRLTARLPEEQGSRAATTTVTTTTPHEVPQLSLSKPFGLEATVEGGTEDQLFFLTVDYHTVVVPVDCTEPECRYTQVFTLQYAPRAHRTPAGYAAELNWEADVDSLWSRGQATVYLARVEVQAGLAHPSAPTYEGLPYDALFRSSQIGPSNVEQGVGFVVGATLDTALVQIPSLRRPVTAMPLPADD